MAAKPQASSPPTSPPQVLTQTDRVLLDLLRDGIAERSEIRKTRVESRAQRPEDTKRARLEQNQERLDALLDEAVARPAINRALRTAGLDIAELQEAGDRGAWRDVVPAINAIRPPAERQADEQRRAAIAEATRAIVDTQQDGQRNARAQWIDTLEEHVRGSFGKQEIGEAAVAKRLMDWAEAALIVVPEPVAASARLALVEHAYGAGPGEAGDDGTKPLRTALRGIFEEDKTGRYARPPYDEAAARPREANRIWLDDAGGTPHGERQVREFADAALPAAPPVETGMLTRLRGLFGSRQAAPDSVQDAGDDDGIPGALKKRYAIHVSDNGKTIELFEAGAKTAAITLDAKSISTPHNEGAVIADIILLARDRGWQSLKVAGTAEFKDAVWLEASKAGLVAQHEPSSAVKAALAKWERERPANQIQPAPPPRSQEPAPRDDLARAFAAKSPEERLADPRLRNAQMELMIGIRTAESELKRPIAEMPEVAKALTAAVREQLASGRVFDAPFVKPSPPTQTAMRKVAAPKIEADRIPPLRP